jgi:hypothetical protein
MTEMLRYRWTSFGPMLDEDGPFVTFADAEALRQAATRERLSGQVQMMDEIARCIADGHRGNGSAEDDVCCQVCEEIQCDPDCAIAVHVEALRQATALATPETVVQAMYWYEQGQRDALAQAVQRVEALVEVQHADFVGFYVNTEAVKRAIKGDQP